MTPLQKGTIWIVGCLIFVFALSVGLSWFSFGYLDVATVWRMSLMLLPILGASAMVLMWTGREEERSPTWGRSWWRKGR